MKVLFQKYQSLIIFCIVIIIPLFAMLPLFHSGFFPMHDDEQVGRLIELHKVLLDGQFPPRWVPDLGFGYGYPLYDFYPPLFYYIGTIFSFVGAGFILSTKLALIVGFIFSSIAMYVWIENRWGKMAGIFAAVVYTYVPYHAVDIYVRGAFSEFFSFIFVPAVFWTMDKIAVTKDKKWVGILSILLGCVVLSHNLVALQAILFIVLYGGFLLVEKRTESFWILLSFVIAGGTALGLSAYFWLPELTEKQFTLVDTILTKELANYAIHFVCPQQLLNSPWGYGGSIAGCMDGLSFQLGKLQIFFVMLATLSLCIKKSKEKIFVGFLVVLFVLSVFMTTEYSKFIWDHFSPYWYIQFPWRFLLFSGVFSAALAGYVVAVMQKYISSKILIIVLVIASFFVIYQVRHDFIPQRYVLVGDDHYISNIKTEVSRMSYEYVPKEVATTKSSLGTTELAITNTQIAKQSYQIISGAIQVEELQNKSQDKKYALTVEKKGIFQINTFAFPGWIAIVDGKKVSYNDTNRLHLIQLPIQNGTHTVEVLFTNTRSRAVGNILSFISIISLVGVWILIKLKKL